MLNSLLAGRFSLVNLAGVDLDLEGAAFSFLDSGLVGIEASESMLMNYPGRPGRFALRGLPICKIRSSAFGRRRDPFANRATA